MPPKPKFTREEIIDAAYEIARESGIESVAARTVGARLGATSSPIFTFFSSMDELKKAVYARAKRVCTDYLRGCADYSPAFKEFGMRYVRFAIELPHLYRLLFTNDPRYTGRPNDFFAEFPELTEPLIPEIRSEFGLSGEDAAFLLNQMLIYSAGVIDFLSNGYVSYSETQLSELLSTACLGLVFLMKTRSGSLEPVQARMMANGAAVLPVRRLNGSPAARCPAQQEEK